MDSATIKALSEFLKSHPEQQGVFGIVTTADFSVKVVNIQARTVEEAIAIRDAQLPGLPLFLRVA